MNSFWSINIGNVAAAVTIIFTLWKFHQSNVRRIEHSATLFQQIKEGLESLKELENRVEVIAAQLGDMREARVKVELIYRWFENNVAGWGERERKGWGGGDD